MGATDEIFKKITLKKFAISGSKSILKGFVVNINNLYLFSIFGIQNIGFESLVKNSIHPIPTRYVSSFEVHY
jgi:hypothetical protein